MDYDSEDLAGDSLEDLLEFQKSINKKTKNGKTTNISGLKGIILKLCHDKVFENGSIFIDEEGSGKWVTPVEIESAFPIQYQSNRIKAAWVWELSQNKGSKFYRASYFDRRSKYTKGGIKKTVAFRLSEAGRQALEQLFTTLDPVGEKEAKEAV